MPDKAKKQEDEQDTFKQILDAIDATEYDPDRHISIQIDTAMRDAIRAAQLSGSSAEVTLKVKIKPGAERRVNFAAVVSAKLPRPSVSTVDFFADSEGSIHRSDPRQIKMAFPQSITPPSDN